MMTFPVQVVEAGVASYPELDSAGPEDSIRVVAEAEELSDDHSLHAQGSGGMLLGNDQLLDEAIPPLGLEFCAPPAV